MWHALDASEMWSILYHSFNLDVNNNIHPRMDFWPESELWLYCTSCQAKHKHTFLWNTFFSSRTAKVRTIVLLLKGLCSFLSFSLYLVWRCFLCLWYISGLVRVSCTVFCLHGVVLCARAEWSQDGVGTSTFFSGPSAKIGWMITQKFFVCSLEM